MQVMKTGKRKKTISKHWFLECCQCMKYLLYNATTFHQTFFGWNLTSAFTFGVYDKFDSSDYSLIPLNRQGLSEKK
jgi:hypothetical protein